MLTSSLVFDKFSIIITLHVLDIYYIKCLNISQWTFLWGRCVVKKKKTILYTINKLYRYKRPKTTQMLKNPSVKQISIHIEDNYRWPSSIWCKMKQSLLVVLKQYSLMVSYN